MSRLDEELRLALQRREPPPGFTERLLARLPARSETGGQPQTNWWQMLAGLLQTPKVRLALAAALSLLIAAGAYQYRQYQRAQAEGQRAKAQVILALQITSAKLNLAQKKIQQRSNRQLDLPPKQHQ